MYECNCIYCKEFEIAKEEQRRITRLARLEKAAMERLLNPPEVDEDEDDYYDDECNICGADLGSSSHYHCYNCGKRCSMMGHWNGGEEYSCDKWDLWEWNLVRDLYE